jgi:hypothetical protein
MKPALLLHSQQVQLGHPTPATRAIEAVFAPPLDLGLLNLLVDAAAGIVSSR